MSHLFAAHQRLPCGINLGQGSHPVSFQTTKSREVSTCLARGPPNSRDTDILARQHAADDKSYNTTQKNGPDKSLVL